MANHGKLEEYDSQEEWSQYIERLEFYFEANGVDDEDKQRAILLSVCGSETYKLIPNLIMPNKPPEKTFAELVELVQQHQHPKPSAIVQRFKFNTRFRKPGESIASYVAELRSLSEHCDFKSTLEEMLRDRLVCGINDEQIQCRLLAESSLDFKKAMKIATSMETAVKNAQYLTHQMANAKINTEKPATLHRVDNQGQGNQPWSKPECGQCGGKHDPQQCKFRDAECFLCHKKGHIARKCRSNTKATGKHQRNDNPNSGTSSNYLNMKDDEIEEEDDNYGIYSLGKGQAICCMSEPYVVDVLVSNESLKMEVNTGAAVSVMNEDTYTLLKKKHPNLELKESKLKEDKNTSVKVNKLLEKYEKVFHEELGTFSGPKAKIYVAEDASPKYYKARPVPYALREKVEKELERLQEEGTIEPVQFADWAAPIVPIVKDDKSIRICGDYKVTVNQAAK
ncbi:Retrovirus-related Pol poly from transposon [Paramuricea clavata]|uniref:Retrovirus-related Pol poly from transposon n=1 Tax=Paramuricea clavata TaxID=317549 RepID=A0A7D9DTQ3_PARCT|nr:Retrovirus-related Pol poly from transposon [Paramuricea clavata]